MVFFCAKSGENHFWYIQVLNLLAGFRACIYQKRFAEQIDEQDEVLRMMFYFFSVLHRLFQRKSVGSGGSEMEDMNEKILWEGYGLRFRGGTRTRTGLICRTDMGLRELKKPRGSGESLRLAFDVKEQLRKNGFINISRFYRTLEGEPFYRYDGILYTLEDVMPPESLPEEKEDTFLRGAETLGKMHHAAKGLQSESARWEEKRLPALYGKRRSQLAKIRRRNDRQRNYDAIDLLLIRYYDRFMEQAQQAEELLKKGGYEAAVVQAAEKGAFCHNAYKGEALRQNEKGEIFVGSFDKCSSELPLADLAHYLRRYFKKTEGSAAGVAEMLEQYGKHQPLSENDLTILQGMLIYPEKFLRLVNEYYNKRRACVSPAMQERLAAAAKEEENGRLLWDMVKKGC